MLQQRLARPGPARSGGERAGSSPSRSARRRTRAGPRRAIPLAYPRGSGQPGGCRRLIATCSRRTLRWTLPVGVRGSSSTNSIRRGYLYGRDQRLDVVLQHARLDRLGGDDVRLDDVPALGVRRRDDRALGDQRVLEQRGLDLEAGDVVARGDDHVVGARLEPEVAVGVHREGVAGQVPAVADVVRLARVVEVAAAGRPAHGEPADRARRQRPHVVVDDPRLVARAPAARTSRAAPRPAGEAMKMCSISVEPMPSMIRMPVFSYHASDTAAGSGSPARDAGVQRARDVLARAARGRRSAR